jgi:hypothetical protein
VGEVHATTRNGQREIEKMSALGLPPRDFFIQGNSRSS